MERTGTELFYVCAVQYGGCLATGSSQVLPSVTKEMNFHFN